MYGGQYQSMTLTNYGPVLWNFYSLLDDKKVKV